MLFYVYDVVVAGAMGIVVEAGRRGALQETK